MSRGPSATAGLLVQKYDVFSMFTHRCRVNSEGIKIGQEVVRELIEIREMYRSWKIALVDLWHLNKTVC